MKIRHKINCLFVQLLRALLELKAKFKLIFIFYEVKKIGLTSNLV